MKSHYDLLIIGGGPGGAIAARTAAKAGFSACIVEKRPAIGAPVRCAEGIGMHALTEFVKPDPCFISAEMERASLVAPDGTTMTLDSETAGGKVGYVLDRKFFDRELVWQAAEQGADVAVKTRASAPLIKNGKVCGAKLEFLGATTEVTADVVIAADGVESKYSKWCGINTTIPLREIMSSAQYVMTGIDIDPHCTVFCLGNEVAPQGYLWVFPKGEKTANVGIGISGIKSGNGHRAKDYLDKYVATHFPDGKTIEYIVGGVSVCRPLECTVTDGLMIVGDAARVVDPLTGGGIYNAMFTGDLAADVAMGAIEKGDTSRAALMPYDTGWRDSKMGKTIERNYHIKEYMITLSDAKLNAIIQSASCINMKEFSTLSLVRELIKRNPKLVLELAALRELIK